MTQSDSIWFVRLHKCLHLTSVLKGCPALDLPVFVNGVWKYGCHYFSLIRWYTVCLGDGNPLSQVCGWSCPHQMKVFLREEKSAVCMTVLPLHALGLIRTLAQHSWWLYCALQRPLTPLTDADLSPGKSKEVPVCRQGSLGQGGVGSWVMSISLSGGACTPTDEAELPEPAAAAAPLAPSSELYPWTCTSPDIPACPCSFVQLKPQG